MPQSGTLREAFFLSLRKRSEGQAERPRPYPSLPRSTASIDTRDHGAVRSRNAR